jgi:hypothetical protein
MTPNENMAKTRFVFALGSGRDFKDMRLIEFYHPDNGRSETLPWSEDVIKQTSLRFYCETVGFTRLGLGYGSIGHCTIQKPKPPETKYITRYKQIKKKPQGLTEKLLAKFGFYRVKEGL